MLDEIQQLKLYTFELPGQAGLEPCRYDNRKGLLIRSEKNGLMGVPQALEIIARWCIFGKEDPTVKKKAPTKRRVDATMDTLKLWSGDIIQDNKPSAIKTIKKGLTDDILRELNGTDNLDNWLPRYLRHDIGNWHSKKPSKRKSSHQESDIEKYSEKWIKDHWGNKTDFREYGIYSKDAQWGNDANRISYQRVIANAFRKGPLRQYCLIGKIDLRPHKGKSNKGNAEFPILKSEKNAANKFRKADARAMPLIIALMAECLHNTANDPHPISNFATVSPEKLALWLCRDKYDSSQFFNYYYKKNDGHIVPLFDKFSESNRTSLKLNEEWIADWNWKLVECEGKDSSKYCLEFCSDHKGEGYFIYAGNEDRMKNSYDSEKDGVFLCYSSDNRKNQKPSPL